MAEHTSADLTGQSALITGGARRIGACVARRLHAAGMTVTLHCHASTAEAEALTRELDAVRPGSAFWLQADLLDPRSPERIARRVAEDCGRLDLLVNNASSYYATPVGTISDGAWDDLVGTNLRAPLFLVQSCLPMLQAAGGNVINMLDIHALRAQPRHAVYGAAKAGLAMLTRLLALELAPQVRVNGIAPGAILWPEGGAGLDQQAREAVIAGIPLRRRGDPQDIAEAVLYLATARFVTAEIMVVDGGRSAC